jgi:hypothetical protein
MGLDFDRRDGLTATRNIRDVTAATHASAMLVLGDLPKSGEGAVLPLRR